VYFKLGQIEKAVEWWKKALEKDPENKGLKEKISRGAL
jgi:tetratricopeptide (TPR) repeat protein